MIFFFLFLQQKRNKTLRLPGISCKFTLYSIGAIQAVLTEVN